MNGLLDQFECVRLVRMNGLDLAQFQFDYDQTWAVLFLRSDGTVLARYGSRNSTDAMTLNSLAGFGRTMEKVLRAHRGWPAGKELYRDKRGPVPEFKRADEIPSETIERIKAAENQGTGSCIHCHNVYDARRDVAIKRGTYDPWKRWKYPLPESIGIEVDPVSGTRITRVLRGSASQRAGLNAGDEILAIEGQAIHSLADIQFALHHLPDETDAGIVVRVTDSTEPVRRSVALETGWREGNIAWRVSMYGMPPRLGLWVQAATDEEKKQLDIPRPSLALKIKGVFGKEVRRAGLKKGDVIIAFGDRTSHHAEGEFQAAVRLNYYRPNSELPLRVIRDGATHEIPVKFANSRR